MSGICVILLQQFRHTKKKTNQKQNNPIKKNERNQTKIPNTETPRGNGFLHRLGDAEHHDPDAERPLLLRGEGEAAELRHNRRRPETSAPSSAASMDALCRVSSPSQQYFPPCPPQPLPQHQPPNLPVATAPGVTQLSSFAVCVASSSGKHAFIASPTAKHFGHEKYINVTTSFITIFIPHLMLSLCDLHTKYIFKGKHVHFYLEKREDTK